MGKDSSSHEIIFYNSDLLNLIYMESRGPVVLALELLHKKIGTPHPDELTNPELYNIKNLCLLRFLEKTQLNDDAYILKMALNTILSLFQSEGRADSNIKIIYK